MKKFLMKTIRVSVFPGRGQKLQTIKNFLPMNGSSDLARKSAYPIAVEERIPTGIPIIMRMVSMMTRCILRFHFLSDYTIDWSMEFFLIIPTVQRSTLEHRLTTGFPVFLQVTER